MTAFRAMRRTIQREAVARGHAVNFADAAKTLRARGDDARAEVLERIAARKYKRAARLRESVNQVSDFDRARALSRRAQWGQG